MGDDVRIQNQIGPNPLKWDKTGKVVEVHQHDQYVIKVDGSDRVTVRKVSQEIFSLHSNNDRHSTTKPAPIRSSTKVKGQKDALGSEKRDVSDPVNTLLAAPESQLECPQGEIEVAEFDHPLVDTRATPPSNSQEDVPNEPSQPIIPQEEHPTAPRRFTRMQEATDKFNMTNIPPRST